MTTYLNVFKEAKAAVYRALTASDNGFSKWFTDTQIVLEMSNLDRLKSRRIIIGCTATPEIVGAVQTGWMATVLIQCLTNFQKYSESQHEDLCAPVENLLLTTDLTTRLSNADFTVQVATPGAANTDFQEDERITQYELELDCFLTGA